MFSCSDLSYIRDLNVSYIHLGLELHDLSLNISETATVQNRKFSARKCFPLLLHFFPLRPLNRETNR